MKAVLLTKDRRLALLNAVAAAIQSSKPGAGAPEAAFKQFFAMQAAISQALRVTLVIADVVEQRMFNVWCGVAP